jgi:hypothetical protein
VEEVLSSVLVSYLKRFPRDPNIIQTQADLQFANSQYRYIKKPIFLGSSVVDPDSDWIRIQEENGVPGSVSGEQK